MLPVFEVVDACKIAFGYINQFDYEYLQCTMPCTLILAELLSVHCTLNIAFIVFHLYFSTSAI